MFEKFVKNNIFIFLVLFFITSILFFPTLHFDFLVDDWVLLWTSKFHPELYGIYWGHPATVAEFYIFERLFGINSVIFNVFGILLRTLTGFVGYLLLSPLTKSKKTGLLFSVFIVTSYIGLQSTTWASAHIVSIDLILIAYTCYRFVLYNIHNNKRNLLIFLTLFLITIITDPGRNFPIIGLLLCFFALQNKSLSLKFLMKKKELKMFLLLLVSTILIFVSWDILVGSFFNSTVARHHTHIPLKPILYYFGSIVNLAIDPLLRTFEFALIKFTSLEPMYYFLSVLLIILFAYSLYVFFKSKSLKSFYFLLFFCWIFLFYFPNWISYPRLFVPAIHRYLTITGFGFLAIFSLVITTLFQKNKLFGIFITCILLTVNIATLEFHISQEAQFRDKNLSRIWNDIQKDIPSKETSTIFYFTGDEPLLTWGVVYSQGNPYRLSRQITDPSNVIIVANILEKIANVLCHRNIQTLDYLKKQEVSIHFRSWNITKEGMVTNTTLKELGNLEKLYQNQNVCENVRKKFGEQFTYYN